MQMIQKMKDVELANQTTFGIPARAKELWAMHSESEAIEAIQAASSHKFMVLGGGSNVLYTGNYNGIILHNCIKGMDVVRENEDYVYVRVGAGEVWIDVVQFALDHNWGGIENLSLIPGCAGAAPIQNIGAYGVEIKDVIDSVSAVIAPEGHVKVYDRASCEFGYRDSIFKRDLKGKFCITYIVLRLSKKPALNTGYGAIVQALKDIPQEKWTIQDVSRAVTEIRMSKLPDPSKLGNAGSFFKNPVIPTKKFEELKSHYPDIPGYRVDDMQTKVPAGWLIEQCGWKGNRQGNTGCHATQALVIVNYGGASGKEIWEHAQRVMQSVRDRFNIALTPEVNVIQ